MNRQTLHAPRRSTLWQTVLGVGGACLISTSGITADNNPVVMLTNGAVIPVKNPSDSSKKVASQTLYLSSALPMKKPTPAPKPSPVSAPVTVKKTAATAHSTASTHNNAASDDPGDDYGKTEVISDPIQPVNRGTFWFNHQLYHYVLHPVVKTYKTVIPLPVRTGVSNVFENVEYPIRFVNDLLQWQPKRAGLETEKFLLNTTAGVGGLFKVSNKIPSLADVPKTDTTATLAKWKVPEGPYIVWPIIGPKSARDTVGFVGDVGLSPVTWVTMGAAGGLAGASAVAVSAPDATQNVSSKLDAYETVTDHAVDRYEAVRSAYKQNRKKAESQ
jgi:phospholipid-binding lipoprotein MlaA